MSSPSLSGSWQARLQTGLRLGLMPDTFWRLSLREWQALTAPKRAGAFRRADLSALLSAFPDTEDSHA